MESEEGDEVRAELPSSLLHPPPLDHTNPFLSPAASPHFAIDDFLLSRAPGSTLKQITSDLQDYSNNLKSQLNIVVDRDFKGFVSLGTALKAEGPRIARLDWKVAPAGPSHHNGAQTLSTSRGGDDEWNEKFDTPRGSGGNLGLDRVRSEVVSVRDQLREAEEAVRLVMRRKEEAEVQKTNLMMLLSLNDSLRRLETLLLAQTDKPEEGGNSSDEEDMGADEQSAPYWQAFTSVDEFPSADSDSCSSEGEGSDAKHQQRTTRPGLSARRTSSRSQRRSSGLLSARRRSSLGINDVVEKSVSAPAAASLSLPTRIARASSEHAALVFLRDRAVTIGFHAYVAAHQARWIQVRELLKDDLRKLIKMLTRSGGPSLLVGAPQGKQDDFYRNMEKAELERWSLTRSSTEERRSEQSAWFESALSTWCQLPASGLDADGSVNGAREAEETIRAALMAGWARETITSDALTRQKPDPRTPKTPFGFGQGSQFANEQDDGEVDGRDDYLLSLDLIDSSSDGVQDDAQAQGLIHLYNGILTFVATQTAAISLAAERVVARSSQELPPGEASPVGRAPDVREQSAYCDVFVRVVWDELGTRLMEQLGGQLFFAGRPEVFHRNYTISMAFLAAFESLAPSDRARGALHQYSVYQTFRKRWQLPVYFQIRLRDTITRLEKGLSSSSGPHFATVSGSSAQRLPLMTATAEALTLFALPWSRGTHIIELVNRQWKLSLQVLTRYKNWVEEELPSDIVIANRRVLDAAKGRSSHDGSRTGSPSRTGTPTVTDVEADDGLLNTFTVIAADMIWLEGEMMATFERVIVPALLAKSGAEGVVKSLRQTLRSSLSMQTTVLPLLSTRITSILKARCAEPLRLVRSVSTQFRVQPLGGSSVASGGEPSSFVVQFLRPVRHFLGKSDGKFEPRRAEVVSRFLDRHVRSQWISDVVEDFVARYAASLQTMNKNYESLRRLKRGNAANSVAPGASSMGFGTLFSRNNSGAANGKGEEDVEARRMHSQMMTDVECLEKEVQDLASVDTIVQTDTPGWKRLKEAARGEQDE